MVTPPGPWTTTVILHMVISVLVGFHPAIRSVHKVHSVDGVRQFIRDRDNSQWSVALLCGAVC